MSRRGVRRAPPPGAAELALARELQRVAVLLSAGLSPARAWALLAGRAERPEATAVVRAGSAVRFGSAAWFGQAMRSGRLRPVAVTTLAGALGPLPPGADPVPTVLEIAAAAPSSARASVAGVAAGLRVAADCGAPLAPTLARTAAGLRGAAEAARRRELAMAGPRAATRIVALLPLLGLLLAELLGFDAVGVLAGTASGRICLVAGLGFAVGAALWMRELLRRARPDGHDPGLPLELAAIALAGGAPLDRAVAGVAAALEEAGLPQPGPALGEALEVARAAGAPPGALLLAEAEESRRDSAAAAERAAVVLGVRLMLPLGLGVLPAFVALGVAPIVVSLVTATLP